jgi:hypothetical protein
MWHTWGRGEAHAELWWGNLNKREHVENVNIVGG